jgi:photosystem II P680 reaction center D1 protein
MNTLVQRRRELNLVQIWDRVCAWITSLDNRLYVGWFGVLMIPTLLVAVTCFLLAFIAAPSVDMEGVREPIEGALLDGNNLIKLLRI